MGAPLPAQTVPELFSFYSFEVGSPFGAILSHFSCSFLFFSFWGNAFDDVIWLGYCSARPPLLPVPSPLARARVIVVVSAKCLMKCEYCVLWLRSSSFLCACCLLPARICVWHHTHGRTTRPASCGWHSVGGWAANCVADTNSNLARAHFVRAFFARVQMCVSVCMCVCIFVCYLMILKTTTSTTLAHTHTVAHAGSLLLLLNVKYQIH